MCGGTGTAGLQWLVWIQLLVMILLILLLYYFSIYASEIVDGEVRVSVSSGLGGLSDNQRESTTSSSFFHSPFKVVGSSSIRGEISTAGITRRITRSQNGTEVDASSAIDVTSNHSVTETHPHHPCSFFKLAREAFLKCLGLDCMAEDSASRKQSKND